MRASSRLPAWLEALAWVLALAPASAVAQLVLLVVTCRIRAGDWPRPYIPDVSSVELPLQGHVYALTLIAAWISLPATPLLVGCGRLAGRSVSYAPVVAWAISFALMWWVFGGDPGGLGWARWAMD